MGAGARSVHLQAGHPFLTGTTGTHACATKSPPGRSLPRAPFRSSRASFHTIVFIVIGIWKRCKNASVFSYMEIVAEKVRV